MPQQVVQVDVKAVIPASGGCAVFLGNDEKVFIIYIDQMVGAAITMFMRGIPKERPLTHDLIVSLLIAYGAKLERVVINDFQDNIYYARLIVMAENELHGRKIMEIDARPSDSIALATRLQAPIFVSRKVWDAAADESHVLQAMQERHRTEDEDSEPGDAEGPTFSE